MLNFTVWAYGDELVSDIGYTHLGGYICSALAHNLVVIDGKNQGFSTMNGSLLSWHAPNDCTMVMQTGAPNIAYSQTHKYRRAILCIPITNGQNIFVDVFEVSGGNRHEWMANGCADYTQKAQMSIEPYKYIDNLDENGIALTPEVGKVVGSMLEKHLPYDRPGDKSQYYGAFRNVKVYRNNKPWQVTITPASPNGEYFPGAGCRAKSKDPKPGLRMHWVAPSDGEVMLCDVPRNRYYKELTFLQDAMANWNKNVMPKIIVRRDGQDLDSTFAAIWEPYKNNPFINSCKLIEDILNHEGVGVNIKTGNSIINAFYRKVENTNPINSGNVRVDGSFLVIKENLISDIEKQIDMDFYNGNSFSMGGFEFELANWSKVILLRNGEDTEGAYLVIKGNLENYPVEIEKQPHREKWIFVQQEGQNSRYLLFDKLIRCCNNEYKVYLSRQSGFKYDYETNMLIEDYFPYHILNGKIEVIFPSDLNIRIIDSGNDKKIMVRTDSDLYLKVPSEFCSTSQLEVYDESNTQCGTISKNAEQQFYIPCSITRGKWVSLIM